MDIAFVILHFNVYEETINCVNSIQQNIDTENYKIVVVDNGSPNASGVVLKERFSENEHVDVLLLEENIGFACGNNAGIDYVRKTVNPKFVCCTNNDTLLEQHDFFEKLEAAYERNRSAVIGPKVILKDGTVQVFSNEILPIGVYDKFILGVSGKSKVEAIKQRIKNSSIFISLNRRRRKYLGLEVDPLEESEDILIHGCCLVFTPAFFEKLQGFDYRTFLYREEELLYISLKKNNLSTLYCPSLSIRHLEDASTNSIGNSKKISQFKKEHLINSTRILIDELSHMRNENGN